MVAVGTGEDAHRLVDRELAGANLLHLTGDTVGHHDLLLDDRGLLDRAEDVTGDELVALGDRGDELPLFLLVQGRDLHSPAQEVAVGDLHDLVQGALDAVVDRADEAGAQLDGERHVGRNDGLAGPEALRLLVDLDGGLVPVNLNDLADQLLVADTDDVEHVRVAHAGGNDQRSGHFLDYSRAH